MSVAVRRFPSTALLASAVLLLGACRKAPPPDPLCTYEPLPESAKAPDGQGAIQVVAPTSEYFYVLDSEGKEKGHAKAGGSVLVKPGEYRTKLNGSTHPVWAKKEALCRCTAGALVVGGTTDEYYYVVDSAGGELAHAKVGVPLGFFPGRYDVKLNGTTQAVDVSAGATAELKSGTLLAVGSTDEYYYVLNAAGTEVAHHKLGNPLAFLAGPLTVKVNGTAASVAITAGAIAEVRTGAVNVAGTTDEYYYVRNATGTELAHAKLGRALSFLEGSYAAKVNDTTMAVKVEAGTTNEVATGTLTVKGNGADYYYVLDPTTGTELTHAKSGQSVALAPGKYSVRLGQETRPAVVTGGQVAVVN